MTSTSNTKTVTYELPKDVIKLIDDETRRRSIQAGFRIPKGFIVAEALRAQLGNESRLEVKPGGYYSTKRAAATKTVASTKDH